MITCFDIGGSTIKAATATSPEALTMLGRVPTPHHDFMAFAAAIAEWVKIGGAPEGAPVAISVTGVVDPASGVVTCANIACIDGLDLAQALSARLDRPVLVANDADCFVLAEAGIGAGQGHRVVFGVILGTGVGGGLVVNGAIHQGAGGLAGEWGHGPVAATEAGSPPIAIPRLPCGCGQSGCVDTVGGARGLERLYAHLGGGEASSREIIAAWQAGDALAARTLECQIDLLAGPLALTVNVVGPDIVPVGGGLGSVAPLVTALDEAVRRRILRRLDRPLVVPAGIAEPGLVGAAILGLSQ
ncbi:MAG: ROK family protein [Devosia sp.]|uniref:ROK family protein n=1 Tax=Devosia sp. TaxID=1871048 RepID=UPI0024CCF92A|nr:ROK family protein [Devosia sp.]UYN99412.1 MAG: ROK family protein [Devosia sp.]